MSHYKEDGSEFSYSVTFKVREVGGKGKSVQCKAEVGPIDLILIDDLGGSNSTSRCIVSHIHNKLEITREICLFFCPGCIMFEFQRSSIRLYMTELKVMRNKSFLIRIQCCNILTY